MGALGLNFIGAGALRFAPKVEWVNSDRYPKKIEGS